MINKFKSSQFIIAKVFRDLRIQDADWVGDAVEWMGEALQAIGSITQLVRKVKIVKSSSHKVKMPSDLYLVEQIRYGYYNSTLEDTEPKLEDFSRVMPYEGNSLHPSLVEEYNTDKSARYTDESFFIQNGYINTSFESDWIAIVYRAVNVDDDGYPMIPDHYSFNQALYWFIVMKMIEGGFKHPSSEIGWSVAELRWLKYCTQARTKAIMPDEAKYEEFLRSWVNLIPNYDADWNNKVAEESNMQHERNAYIVNDGNLELF